MLEVQLSTGWSWWFDARFCWFLEFRSFAHMSCQLCLIFTCPSRMLQMEERTKSKTIKHSVKPPWSPCSYRTFLYLWWCSRCWAAVTLLLFSLLLLLLLLLALLVEWGRVGDGVGGPKGHPAADGSIGDYFHKSIWQNIATGWCVGTADPACKVSDIVHQK